MKTYEYKNMQEDVKIPAIHSTQEEKSARTYLLTGIGMFYSFILNDSKNDSEAIAFEGPTFFEGILITIFIIERNSDFLIYSDTG